MKIKHFNLPFAVRLYKALGDESRIRILNLLAKAGPLCISDLELILGFTQTKTSRQVAYLKNAGLLMSLKKDQRVFCAVKEELSDLLSKLTGYSDRDSTLTTDFSTYKALHSNRELAAHSFDRLLK